MNDPNGLIQWQGRHHLYYQYNPDGIEPVHQHWGHASSVDLVSWTEHPIALTPGGAGSSYDATACYSGCAFVVDGRVAILYTGVDGEDQLGCLAFAADDELSSFDKDDANPVIAEKPDADVGEMRDHTVWVDGGLWRQAMAGSSMARGGALFGFSSTDLRDWTYDGLLMDGRRTGLPGLVWECPDVFRLDGVDVVVVSVIRDADDPGPEVWWTTGTLEGSALESAASGPLDLGNLFYAPQSYWAEDGRRLMFGWLRTHLDAASEGTDSRGAMSLPREVSYGGHRVLQAPAQELTALRSNHIASALSAAEGTRLWTGGMVAGELVLDSEAWLRLIDVSLVDENGVVLHLDLQVFGTPPGELRLFWDAGIVEVFQDGRAAAFSDLRLGRVTKIHLSHTAGGSGLATVWELRRPGAALQ